MFARPSSAPAARSWLSNSWLIVATPLHKKPASDRYEKTNGLFIRFSLKLPLEALVMVRMLLGF